MEQSSGAESAAAPVRFQKELIHQQPRTFIELEVKKSYQRVLAWSLKKRMADTDKEEEMLRHVQLKQTYRLLRKHKL